MKIETGNVGASIRRLSPGRALLSLQADAFAPYVLITTDNPYIQLSDNSFYMEKGERREIELSIPSGELWGDFTYTWWKGPTRKILLESELLNPIPIIK